MFRIFRINGFYQILPCGIFVRRALELSEQPQSGAHPHFAITYDTIAYRKSLIFSVCFFQVEKIKDFP